MLASSASSYAHPSESSYHSNGRFKESSGSQAKGVETIADKASHQLKETDTPKSSFRHSPSVVYVKSETYIESSYSQSIKTSRSEAVKEQSGSDIASGNILSFIESQLERDLQDGASVEELTSRIEAGLSGFLKGFEQASEDIESLGSLTPEIKADIQKTYDKVVNGVESLKAQYLGDGKKIEEKQDEPESLDVEEISNSNSAKRFESKSFNAAQENSFSFSVVTRDGDEVTIKSSALRSMIQETVARGGVNNGLLQARFAISEKNEFQFEVDGELDSGEMRALTDLLSQVNDLAENFFSGDVEAAFNAALNLGYDESEISAFALNLSQTSVQKITSAYKGNGSESTSTIDELRPVGSFVRDLMEATRLAENFQHPKELIEDIAYGIESSRSQTGFKSLIERLIQSFNE